MGHKETVYSVIRKIQPPRYSFETKAYDQAQLICVMEGELWYDGHERDETLALHPGMFVLLRGGSAFALLCRDAGYTGIGVGVTGDLPAALQGAALAGVGDSRMRVLIDLIARHMDAPLPESARILRGFGEAMVWEVLALMRERRAPERRDWATAARTALDLNVGTGRPVREVLASLPVSYRQVTRCFRERYGTSPKSYHELLRINEARRLLGETRMEITAIAVELGYSSSQHFASQFRGLVGCTPTVFRSGVDRKGRVR